MMFPAQSYATPPPKKLLDRVREKIRLKRYSRRTEDAYIAWSRQYIVFHHKRHPSEMGIPEIEAFLTHLAINRHVAASTQNQVLSALLFLYRDVLNIELQGSINQKNDLLIPAQERYTAIISMNPSSKEPFGMPRCKPTFRNGSHAIRFVIALQPIY